MLPKKTTLLIIFVLISLTVIPFQGNAQLPVHPNAGVGLIWYGGQGNLSSRNEIVSVGQIFFMWRDFEPSKDKYNLTALEENMKNIYEKGMVATLQINGNRHPDYIYKMIPYLKGIVIGGSRDHVDGYGPVMYWHADYKDRYSKMMNAIAEFIKNSPYRDAILGIRQSYNAIGTEHDFLENKFRDKSAWTIETEATWGEPWPWTSSIAQAYKVWSIDMYIDAFKPKSETPVFLRAGSLNGVATPTHKQMVENGELWIFHTSTEPQPRKGKEDQYRVFVNYAKTGKTYAFMESWSKAVTSSGGWNWGKTKTPITLHQFNYWSLLCDLHCGATFPAMRPEDVDVKLFRDDYEFTAKYAGYISAPIQTPGVWIAFREGDYLVGDYTFMLNRKNDDRSFAIYNEDNDKRGLWARAIREVYPMELVMNSEFASSLQHTKNVKFNLWYKDEGEGTIQIDLFDQSFKYKRQNTGEWKLLEQLLMVEKISPNISIHVSGDNLKVHMFEIERGAEDSVRRFSTLNIGANETDQISISPWGKILFAENDTVQLKVLDVPDNYNFSHWSIKNGNAVIVDSLSENTITYLNGGINTIEAVFRNTTSVNEKLITGMFFQKKHNLLYVDVSNIELKIVDIYGRVHAKYLLKRDENIIDLSFLDKGIYIAVCISKNGKMAMRFMNY